MSKADATTLDALAEGLADRTSSDEPSSRRLGEKNDGGVMPLSIERLGSHMFSLVHCYADGGGPVYTVALEVDADGIAGVFRRRYASPRDFIRMWLRHLPAQHGIR